MIRIAVVGDIGSGKSYVAKLFGYPVFNADNEVSRIYKKNKKCFNKLKKMLPLHIFSFPIKKNEILKAIVDGKHNLKKIIKVVHPEVQYQMKKFLKKNKKKKCIILDIPLLMENKINKKTDILIFVQADKNEITRRLKKRNGFNLKVINKFKKIQLSAEIKKRKSNYIVKNNFKHDFIKKSVKNIKRNILLNA
tara:strand:- start:69 stop:647 length:579 start_codon:yes stop_codon:yes gene_type:complete